MQDETDRERAVDWMLRETLRQDARGGPAEACVDAETMAAWTEAALPPAEMARVEMHVSSCPSCQAFVAALARTEQLPVAPQSLWTRWHLRWFVPVAATATAVAIWVAVPGNQPPSTPLRDFSVATGSSTPQTGTAPPQTGTPPAPSSPSAAMRDAPSEGSRAASEPSALSSAPAKREQDASDPDARADVAAKASPREPSANDGQPAVAAEAAAPPAAAAAPPAAGGAGLERRESMLMRAAPAAVEILSPVPSSRWRILSGARVEHSTTGGSTWEEVPVTAPGMLTAGSSPDRLVCWLAGRAGLVRLTTDGKRFDVVPFPETVDLVDVRAASAASAIVTASDGRRFRTDDQGKTWNLTNP